MAESTFLDNIFHSIPGKIFVVITQTVLSSLLLLLTFTLRSYGDITLLKYSIVLVVGLLAGFSARRILAGYTWALKLLAALFSAALSLAMLYILSGGFLGINLTSGSNQATDWTGLIQLGLTALGALLVVTAFRSPSRIKDIPAPEPKTPRSTREPKPALINWPMKLGSSTANKRGQKSSRSTGTNKASSSLAIQKSTDKTSSLQKVAVESPKTRIKKPARVTNKRVKNKKTKEIKLVGEIEHTCPYCLDPVQPNDPRGVKICKICKTHHHADSSMITGACQIPHSQEKN